jgi:pyruvate formate lyase activating enzyme
MKGLVLNIQRFSTHDGPGVRTAVFLKGCTNNCAWCHNPESIRPRPEVQFFPERCIGCGRCLEVCPEGAHQLVDGEKVYHRRRCHHCGRCAEECFSGALVQAGQSLEAGEVMAQILEDAPYYRHSEGGATFSGGEPLMQKDFLRELLQSCQAEGIHTAVETAGNYPWIFLHELLPSIDLVIYDLKLADPERHRRYIGNDGEQVRANLLFLGASDKPLIVRTPVIGGINDIPEEIGGIARFIADFPGLLYYELLPYHGLGRAKLQSLGMEDHQPFTTPPRDHLRTLAEVARQFVGEVRPNELSPAAENAK